MKRYIDRNKIEYEMILGANGHFVLAARKELIDRLPDEDVEPVSLRRFRRLSRKRTPGSSM